MSRKQISVVWNGCDGHDESTEIIKTTHEIFKPFIADVYELAELPVVDGEIDCNGFSITNRGTIFKL